MTAFGTNLGDIRDKDDVAKVCGLLGQQSMTAVRKWRTIDTPPKADEWTRTNLYGKAGISVVVCFNFHGKLPSDDALKAFADAVPSAGNAGCVWAEIGNECDDAVYFPQPGDSVGAYLRAASILCPIFRAKGWKTVLANTQHGDGRAWRSSLKARGGYQYFDAIGAHVYTNNAASALAAYKQLLADAQADGKEVVVTECGLHMDKGNLPAWAAELTKLYQGVRQLPGTFLQFPMIVQADSVGKSAPAGMLNADLSPREPFWSAVLASKSTPVPTPPPAPVPPVIVTPPPVPVPVPTPTPAPKPTPAATQAVITLSPGPNLAGIPIFVNALASTFATGDQLGSREASAATQYRWTFGDPGSGPLNECEGWNQSHVYDNPGNYAITLTITDAAGVTSSATLPITIAPGNRRSIYVDPAGDDSRDGSTEATAVKSHAQAFKLAGVDGNAAVLYKCGGTFPVTAALRLPKRNVRLGSYGQGPQPIIWLDPQGAHPGWAAFSTWTDHDGLKIEDLEFDGPGAVADDAPAPKLDRSLITNRGANVCIRRCTFRNIDVVASNSGNRGLYLQGNTAPLKTGLRAYFAWLDGVDNVIDGNEVANSTREHVVRSSSMRTDRATIVRNKFTNIDREPVDGGDEVKTTINIRAGRNVFIKGNALACGTLGIGPTEAMDEAFKAEWVLIDDNDISEMNVSVGAGSDHVFVTGSNRYVRRAPDTVIVGIGAKNPAHPLWTLVDVRVAEPKGTFGPGVKLVKQFGTPPAGALVLGVGVVVSN